MVWLGYRRFFIIRAPKTYAATLLWRIGRGGATSQCHLYSLIDVLFELEIEIEMDHTGNCHRKSAENLSYVGNLPINPFAHDDSPSMAPTQGWIVLGTKPMGIHVEGDLITRKCSVCMLHA